MKDKPLISIITINLNNLEGLKKTANSIPKVKEVEWVFVDGFSSDGSIEFINQHNRKPDHLIIENDHGIYDAMNKGIDIATGEYIWFINSGDTVYSECDIVELKTILVKNGNIDLLYGDYILDNNGSSKLVSQNQAQIDFLWMFSKTLNHQSYLLRTEHLKKIKFNLDYNIIADWIQLFESFKCSNLNTVYYPHPLVTYDRNGFSFLNEEKRLAERKKYLNSIYSHWELESFLILSKLRNRKYYFNLVRNLESPTMNNVIFLVLKLRNSLRR
jgi:glycosyltransferase involved in cell wall biosynthesis